MTNAIPDAGPGSPGDPGDSGDPGAPVRTPTWVAAREPDRPAIVMGATGEVVTYAQLEDRSSRLARAFRAHGLANGDHLAVLMENNRPYLEVCWAAQRAGLHYTCINHHLQASEVQYVLDDCGATALVASEAMADVVAGLDLTRVALRISAVGDLPGFERYDAVLAAHAPGPLPDEEEGREMLYSSGTTGRPKGVRKARPGTRFGDPAAAPVVMAERAAARGGDHPVSLTPAPLYHATPLVVSMTAHRIGGTLVLMERFDAALCLELVDRYGVTDAQFVPTMFVRLLRLPPEVRAAFSGATLQRVSHGGAPCPVPVKRQMIDWWGPIIDEYYAGTEDVGTALITSEEWLAHPGSVGRPLDECHILDDDGDELPVGEAGLVHFASTRVFEYHNDPEKTAAMRSPQGWRTLGDIGYLDADGYLYLTDRKAHMIISGGVNIYPQEAENVLASHPAVADVAVIGVPDDEMGEAVKAVVEPVDPSAAGDDLAAVLIGHCRAELAHYKCPRSVDFVTALPRDPSGKLHKRRLRERYWEGHDSLIT